MSNLVVTVQDENPSFLSDKIQLQKLLKSLNKASQQAVEVLIQIMETTKDEKLKAQCAEKIIGFKINIEKEVSQDQFQRLIAEMKFNQGPRKTLIPLDEDKPQRPKVDFSTVRQLD